MSDLTWSDAEILAELDSHIERRIAYSDALTAMNKMRADYATELTVLDGKLLFSEEKISGLNRQVSDLNGEIALLDGQIADLEGKITTLDGQIAVLEGQVLTLTSQNTTLKGQNTALKDQNSALTIQLADLTPDVVFTIAATPKMTSNFETAISHVTSKDLLWANATAKAKGMVNLGSAITYHQRHLLGWGTPDPWAWDGIGTRPAEPTNWGTMDSFMAMGLEMGGKLAVNTQLYSWHLKGRWMADGSTQPMTVADQFSDDGVLLTNQVPAYLLLIKRLAERYLVAPWNVEVWTTGTEFHGLYRGRNKTFNEWRWDDYAGTPGANADMGMAYIHNITVAKIIEVAVAKGIDPAKLKFIFNYPPLSSQGKPTGDSVPVGHPLYGRPWGTANKQPVSILKNMPPLLTRYDAGAFDIATPNKDGVVLLTDDFAQLQKIDDMAAYARSLISKPLAVLEVYDKPQTDLNASPQKRAAIRADAFRHFLLNGIWTVYIWGSNGAAMNTGSEGAVPAAALLTDTSKSTGGDSTAMLDVVRMFHNWFGPGTPIYDVTVTGSGAALLPSDKMAMLISQSPIRLNAQVDGDVYLLDPYEVRMVVR